MMRAVLCTHALLIAAEARHFPNMTSWVGPYPLPTTAARCLFALLLRGTGPTTEHACARTRCLFIRCKPAGFNHSLSVLPHPPKHDIRSACCTVTHRCSSELPVGVHKVAVWRCHPAT